MNGFSSAISGVGSAIGRYFSVVSFIPSLFLVGYTFALIESGAWIGSGAPNWAKAGNAFTHIGNLALLTLISIALGVAVHPIQFALVQFFEGYWGMGRLAQRARAVGMWYHTRKRELLREDGPGPTAGIALYKSPGIEGRDRITLISKRDESRRLARGYPRGDDDIMPTRLGNVLRRYERLAGSQYKLDAATVIRHVAFAAPPEHVGYLNDERQLLDLSVRMCATSIFATLISIAFLWHHGPWLAVALVPYIVAYLSYRGAVVVAHEYGAAISTLIDVDRFALYDQIRMRRPESTTAERHENEKLIKLLRHNPAVELHYEHRDVPIDANAALPTAQQGTQAGGDAGNDGGGQGG